MPAKILLLLLGGVEWRKRARKRSRPLLGKSVDDQGADEAGHGEEVGGVEPGLPIQLLLMCTCEQSCKISVNCVNLLRKQCDFPHNLHVTTRCTQTKCDFGKKLTLNWLIT